MRGIKLITFRARNGRLAIFNFEKNQWLIECSFSELPKDIQKQAKEAKEKGELLKKMVS